MSFNELKQDITDIKLLLRTLNIFWTHQNVLVKCRWDCKVTLSRRKYLTEKMWCDPLYGSSMVWCIHMFISLSICWDFVLISPQIFLQFWRIKTHTPAFLRCFLHQLWREKCKFVMFATCSMVWCVHFHFAIEFFEIFLLFYLKRFLQFWRMKTHTPTSLRCFLHQLWRKRI